MITQADKKVAVVIWDVRVYSKEANKQLDEKKFCKNSFQDSMKRHRNLFSNTIKDFETPNILKENVADALITHKGLTPHFYL